MPDLIKLNDLRVRGRHGASADERQHEQDFVINLEVTADLKIASKSDTLSDTINYSTLHKTVVHIVQSKSYHLLERLAADILHEVFEDDRVERARISIAKPSRVKDCTVEIVLDRVNHKKKRV
jgi:dihydroneopterin aldolase